MKKAGIVLMVIGLIISIYTGVNFVTKEKVVDIGKLEITADRHHGMEWSPVIGVVLMAFGACAYFFSSKKTI
jgi:hypothetical protein